MKDASNQRRDEMTVYTTCFDPIGYTKIAPGYWSFIAQDDAVQVGPRYHSKAELLADLPRYASDSWGLS